MQQAGSDRTPNIGKHSTRDGRLARQGVLYGGMVIRFHSYFKFCISVYIPYKFYVPVYTFTQVIWKRLYEEGAYKDAGTLAQLKSLINRTNVPRVWNQTRLYMEVHIRKVPKSVLMTS